MCGGQETASGSRNMRNRNEGKEGREKVKGISNGHIQDGKGKMGTGRRRGKWSSASAR